MIQRAFGAQNRARLLDQYFTEAGPVTAANAWRHIYRLLLWIDRTTGLAHCYESDKSQAGRPWYARSMAFHAWVAAGLGVPPAAVGNEIDILFKQATADLAASAAARLRQQAQAATHQRAPYLGRGFPEPGEDAELEAIITDALSPYLLGPPPEVVPEFVELEVAVPRLSPAVR